MRRRVSTFLTQSSQSSQRRSAEHERHETMAREARTAGPVARGSAVSAVSAFNRRFGVREFVFFVFFVGTCLWRLRVFRVYGVGEDTNMLPLRLRMIQCGHFFWS